MPNMQLVLIFIFSIIMNTTLVWADRGKLDAGLSLKLKTYNNQQTNKRLRALENNENLVAATIQFSGNALTQLPTYGVKIRSVLGSVATVLIPINQLATVAALPEVLHLETPSRPVARLYKSVAFTRADTLRTGSLSAGWGGNTGKDVLIGVIDSGIDINHKDFRDAAGKTRIVRL